MLRNLLFLSALVAVPSCQSEFFDEPSTALQETGVLVIDVQKLFIPGETAYFPKYTPPEDVTPILDNLERLVRLSDRTDLPLFLTYELSDEGDSGLADRLVRALPPGKPRSFVKSYFNATAHPEFAELIRDSGVRRLIVGGAETDVCVLQTVLGLLQMGIEVDLLRDSVFTNEFNYEPALLRMEQAGARMITFKDFEKSVLQNKPIEASPRGTVPEAQTPVPISIKPDRIALVVIDLLKETVDQATGNNRMAILQRMGQTLLAGYVFDVPLFLLNDTSMKKGLPEGFHVPKGDVSCLDRTTLSAADTPGLVNTLNERGIVQVALLGVNRDNSVLRSAQDLYTAGFQTFLMEDAILSGEEQAQMRKSRLEIYRRGVVPLTYKAFYYGMTKAADRRDWPSRQWPQKMQELAETDAGLVRIYELLPMQVIR